MDTVAIIIFLIWTFFWLVIGKIVFDHIIYRGISLEEEILGKNNNALATSFSGFIVGLGFILGESADPFSFILYSMGYIVFSLILLVISLKILDLIFLQKLNIKEEILINKNLAVGLIEGSFGISVGLVIYGALSGDNYYNKEIISTSLETLLFYFIGQIFFILSGIILSFILKIDFQQELKKGNTAAAIAFGGTFISISNVVRYTISGESLQSLILDIWNTCLYFVFAILVFLIFILVFDYIIFRKFKFSDELKEPNLSVGIMLAGLSLVISFLLVMILP